MSTPENENQQATRREAFVRLIASRLPTLSLDELRVVDVILGRVIGKGRDSYGPLNLGTDQRDFVAEASDELADAIWYLGCNIVAKNDARLERLRCEAEDEIARMNPVEHGLRELAANAPEPIDHLFDVGGES